MTRTRIQKEQVLKRRLIQKRSRPEGIRGEGLRRLSCRHHYGDQMMFINYMMKEGVFQDWGDETGLPCCGSRRIFDAGCPVLLEHTCVYLPS